MDRRNNYSEDCRALSVLVKALMSGIAFFSGVSILLYYSGEMSFRFKSYGNIVLSIGLVLSAVCVLVARLLHTKAVQGLKESNLTGKQKLQRFRSMVITHMAVCEFVALLGIICFLVFGNFLFFIMVAISLVEMFSKFPTVEKIDDVVNSRLV